MDVYAEEDYFTLSFNGVKKRVQFADQTKPTLKQTANSPGSQIAMDQYMHTTPGHGPSITGITPASLKYVGSTLFVDCATGYIHCVHQTTLNALEMLLAKQKFEQDAMMHRVQVKRYP